MGLIRSWQKAGLAAALLLAGAAYAADLTQAENLYKHTDFEGSLRLLNKQSSDAAETFLIGRNYFMQGDFKKATDYILKATTLAPTNSEYMDWLGRTYGKPGFRKSGGTGSEEQ
jgi:Flp pilus assembly protein TadD